MADKEVCLLCGNIPDEGMHITGQKFIKGDLIPYQLCRSCSLPSSSSKEDRTTSRNKVWKKVEDKLLKIKKQKK